jgi:hypothetical protein
MVITTKREVITMGQAMLSLALAWGIQQCVQVELRSLARHKIILLLTTKGFNRFGNSAMQREIRDCGAHNRQRLHKQANLLVS